MATCEHILLQNKILRTANKAKDMNTFAKIYLGTL